MTTVPEALPPLAAENRSAGLLRVFPASPPERLRIFLGVALGVLWAMSLLGASGALLNDPDTLWHIAVGRDIWASGSFPKVDAYSHSFAGEPWIAKEWLAQIVLYGAYATGGWNGVVLLTVATLFVVFMQVYWALSSRLKPVIAGGVAFGAMALCSDVFIARPHIIVLPVVILFVSGVWSAARRDRAPSFWLLGVLCLWANLHGSFTFGIVAALFAFGLYLDRRREMRAKATFLWLAFLALTPVASIVHPYGFDAILSTITIAESEALPYVSEWRAFSVTEDMKMTVALLVLIVAALTAGFRAPLAAAAFVSLLIYMYLTHTRFSYLLALLTPLILAPDLGRQFAAQSYKQWAGALGGKGVEAMMARWASAGVGVVAAFAIGVAAAFVLSVRSHPPTSSYPAEAIEAARAARVAGNVLNSYNFGGALIFEGEATFIDGRADRLFQNGFMPEIERTQNVDGEDALRRQLDRYRIGWSLLERGDGRIAHLDSLPNWTRVYASDAAVVHQRLSR